MLDIIILEDDPERQVWFKKTFAGNNVCIMDDVGEMLQKIASNKYDLICLDRDLGKPGENGEDLAWYMFENKLAKETPVIIHSMNERGQRVIAKYLEKYKKNVYSMRFNDLKKYSYSNILDAVKISTTRNEKEIVESQSAMDFLIRNIHQIKGLTVKDGLNKIKAAESLYEIWRHEKNHINNDVYQKPESISYDELEMMKDEGLVTIVAKNRFRVTAEGSKFLKTMILGDNRSAFSKDNNQKLEYRTAKNNTKKNTKLSSWIDKIIK